MTTEHQRFVKDFPEINLMKIMGIDVASADLLYASRSTSLTLCSTERYMLELHKFLTLRPAHRYLKETWEGVFDNGRDWYKRCRLLAAYNNSSRPKRLQKWNDLSIYYCLLAMSSFRVSYSGGSLIGENDPTTPDYEEIREHYLRTVGKTISYRKRNIFTLPMREIDGNTLLYFHIPSQYGTYGNVYRWTKKEMEFMVREMTSLATEGYKVCVSGLYERRGIKLYDYESLFAPDLFHPVFYESGSLLKATRNTEVYYIANF